MKLPQDLPSASVIANEYAEARTSRGIVKLAEKRIRKKSSVSSSNERKPSGMDHRRTTASMRQNDIISK